jgi:hypothetical protein
VEETDDAGEAALRVSEARNISSANDRISSREVVERDTEPGDVWEDGLEAILER